MRASTIPAVLLATLVAVVSGCTEDSASSADSSPSAKEVNAHERMGSGGSMQRGLEASEGFKEEVVGSNVLEARHAGVLALSAEEAAWLDRNGYPTQAELDAWQSYDTAVLDSAMRNRGDPKSAALLGHKLLMEGDLDSAVGVFSQGAYLGSLYSQQQLAIVSAQRASGLSRDELANADPGIVGVMVARLEMARMLGDHRAQALIDQYAVKFDWNAYGKQILTQTAIFMDQYGEYARARGERVRGPDPRPNADAWANLRKDPNGLVTVYTRGRSWP